MTSSSLQSIPLVTLTNPAAARGEAVPIWDFLSVQVSPAGGFGLYNLSAQGPDGKPHAIFGALSVDGLNNEMVAKPGPYVTNSFYHGGSAPLFPLSNRLRGEEIKPGIVSAVIEGCPVTAPTNRTYSPDGKRCHMHGLLIRERAAALSEQNARDEVQVIGEFPHPFGDLWTGDGICSAQVTLSGRSCHYQLTFENTSHVPIPVGAGAHPYFSVPSGNFENIELHIPGTGLVEIDNYKNVFPTGKILNLSDSENPNFQFSVARALNGRYLDNCWVNLAPDENGFVFAELIDRTSGVKIKISGTTENIIGIQAYAPEKSNFVALELVTHLPDPRREVWGEQMTGIKVLQPGERFTYGYKIEILSI